MCEQGQIYQKNVNKIRATSVLECTICFDVFVWYFYYEKLCNIMSEYTKQCFESNEYESIWTKLSKSQKFYATKYYMSKLMSVILMK